MRSRSTCLAMALLCTSPAIAAPDTIITDQTQIDQFLKEPDTKIFNLTVPANWKNTRVYIEVGTQITGGCSYSSPMQPAAGESLISMEMAVNRHSCRSLVVEGSPDQPYWERLKEIFRSYPHTEATSSGPETTLYTPPSRPSAEAQAPQRKKSRPSAR